MHLPEVGPRSQLSIFLRGNFRIGLRIQDLSGGSYALNLQSAMCQIYHSLSSIKGEEQQMDLLFH
jgi:hypothetical protein